MGRLEDLALQTDFSAVLKDAIISGMNAVFGAGGARTILFHLEMPNLDDPKVFHDKVSAIFGPGTLSLETVILQGLFQRVGVPPKPQKDNSFLEYVMLAKRQFDANNPKGKSGGN